LDDCAQHPANVFLDFKQAAKFLLCEIAITLRRKQPVLRFVILCVSIGQFTEKMRLIASLAPRFRDIGSHGTGRSTDLISQRKSFFWWPALGEQKYLPGQFR
jgi:hypothetical protein